MTSANFIQLAAHRRDLMDRIVIPNVRIAEAHAAFDFVVEHGILRANQEKLCVPLIAESQSGKSTIIQSYAASKNTAEALGARRIPVLHVTLEANVTRKGLAQNILEAIEEFGFEAGSKRGEETVLLQRVRTALKLAQVQLLVLDEFQHLVHSESEKVASSVGETIKRLLIKGVCPIVMSGTEKAELALKDQQIKNRFHKRITLGALKDNKQHDLELLFAFLKKYGNALEAQGIARNGSLVAAPGIPPAILEISMGILGKACNLIKEAVQIMTLNGRHELDASDFALAANSFIQKGLYDRNPFLEGLKPLGREK